MRAVTLSPTRRPLHERSAAVAGRPAWSILAHLALVAGVSLGSALLPPYDPSTRRSVWSPSSPSLRHGRPDRGQRAHSGPEMPWRTDRLTRPVHRRHRGDADLAGAVVAATAVAAGRRRQPGRLRPAPPDAPLLGAAAGHRVWRDRPHRLPLAARVDGPVHGPLGVVPVLARGGLALHGRARRDRVARWLAGPTARRHALARAGLRDVPQRGLCQGHHRHGARAGQADAEDLPERRLHHRNRRSETRHIDPTAPV